MTAPLLEVEGLRAGFGAVEAVRGLSFTVAAGETLAIVGESGSGKSATALAILRLIEREGGRIDGGRIQWRGGAGPRDLATLPESAMRGVRGAEIAMIFQEPMTALNPVLSIGDQLAETLRLHRGLTRRDARAESARMLARVRIADAGRRLRQYPHELSGGLRQRVMIAMALSCRPKLLIADEPTTALDVTTQAEILALIAELRAETGMGVLFITHDMGVVAEIADRVLVMKDGAAVETGAVRTLFAQPKAPYARALLAAAPRRGEGGPPPAPADAPGAAPVLEIDNLTVRFPIRAGIMRRTVAEVCAVERVSLLVRRGETLGLVGESGCGKSTLARAALRLTPVRSGAIRIEGRDVTGLSGAALKPMRRAAQIVFQDPFAALNPRLPAWDLTTEPAAIHGLAASRADRRDLAAALMRRVGLSADMLDRYAHQFSGGQRQRLCIARALSVGPSLVVADEAVSALDVSVARQVTELLCELQARDGLAFLFISHDIGVVERMSHRIAVMYAGEIVETGPAAAVLEDPRHAYTRRLLAAVPSGDPRRRNGSPPAGSAAEPPSLIRPVGAPPRSGVLSQIESDRFVRRDAA